jgi:hypothetical protein
MSLLIRFHSGLLRRWYVPAYGLSQIVNDAELKYLKRIQFRIMATDKHGKQTQTPAVFSRAFAPA